MIAIGWTIILIVGVGAGIAVERARRRRLAPFLTRTCAGREWRRRFPVAGKDDIRDFLNLFVDAFALHPGHFLKFRPTDQLMDVYRALYRPKWSLADCCELEFFSLLLKKRYALELTSIWRADLSLGEVFDSVLRSTE
jgi:propanediol dehydratase small subunit